MFDYWRVGIHAYPRASFNKRSSPSLRNSVPYSFTTTTKSTLRAGHGFYTNIGCP
ncbi:hypothetical protein M378DRAFT_167665 [Amanita muscaria Koide BX008]|uniref:Uncharacterized protein n=1 Tax=Amanita muscaria (strain Koide BX008) TaxID=946122 RepID=A0A0C2WWW3_AMAMK|nr:hypothetical protein M378DRAFT_167665 [Amanita muscaria Koide BX008]